MQKLLQNSSPGCWNNVANRLRKISGSTAIAAALMLSGGLYAGQAQAQTANQYNFAASSGTFTPLGATATLVPGLLADGFLSPLIPFPNGFTFNFEGTTYTGFKASSDGYISFGTSTSNNLTNNLATTTTAMRPVLAPLWDDLDGRATGGSTASYEVTGTAGSQVFTFEWLNWEFNYASTVPVISFQVKLYEANGKIEYIYRSESGAVNSGTASIGIGGVLSTNFVSLNNTTASPAASTSTSTNNLNTKPATGQVYTFTKPVATDIGALALATPGTTGCFGPNQTVTVTVKNFGTSPINFATTPLTLTASAAGPNPATFPAVTVNTGTLAAGATQDIIVSTTYNMTTFGTYTFSATTSLTGDGFAANDAMPAQTRINVSPASLPQQVDFAGFTGNNLPALFPGWNEATGTPPTLGGSDWTNDDFGNVVSGPNGIAAKINLYDIGKNAWIVGPKITATATTALKFDLALTVWNTTNTATLGSDDLVQVMVSTDCGLTFTPIRTYNATTPISNTGQKETISLSSYAGQNIIVAFFATEGTVNDTEDNDIFIDNIFLGTPPTIDLGISALTAPAASGCFTATQPVTVTLNNLTTSAINFSTNPATVTVNVTGAVTQTLTTTINTGTLAGTSSQAVTVGTLNMTAVGTYTINSTVSVTGDGNPLNDAMPAATRTVTPVVSLPQNVNFTGFTGSNLNTLFPNWMEQAGATVPSGTTSSWTSSTGLGGSTNTTAKLNLYNTSHQDWIVGPKVLATANTFFQFKAAITDYFNLNPDPAGMQGTDDKVQVMVSTDCGLTFTPVFTLDATNTVNLTNVLTDFSVPLGTYAGQNIIVAIFGTDGPIDDAPDYDVHIDDLSIRNITATDLTAFALNSPVVFNGCYGTSQNVSLTVKNTGSAPLSFATNNATVSVVVSGAATQTLSTTLNSNALNGGNPLAVGATLNVPLGTLNMSALGNYTFNATAITIGDGVSANDTLSTKTITVSAPVPGTASASLVTLCQSGATTLNLAGSNGGNVQWQQSTSATGPFTNITGGTTAPFSAPNITQTTYYRAIVSCGTNNATSNVVTVTVNNPTITASSGGTTTCGPGTATLSATPSTGANIIWYNSATSTTPLATGSTYAPSITATTTYYAAAATGVSEKAGKMSTTGADGTNTGGGLIFNASAPFVLDSVVVYSNVTAGGSLIVNLTDASNAVLQTATVTLPPVTARTAIVVPLNFNVPAGTGLKLVQGSSLGLYRDYTASTINYPYTSPSQLVTITDGTLTGYYYFFYRWSISNACVSARTPVIATLGSQPAAPTVTLAAGSSASICQGGTTTLNGASTATGVTYTWLKNGSPIAGATTNTYTANTSGSYQVVVTNATNCSNTSAAFVVTVNPLPTTPTITQSGGAGHTLTSSSATGNQWYLNGNPIQGATSQTYTTSANGNYTVIVTTNGCASTASAAVNITNTGISKAMAGMSINIAPNPNNGTFNVKLTGYKQAASLELYSLTGQLIVKEKIKAGQEVTPIQVNNLAAGTYLLKVISEKGIQMSKLIVE